MIVDLPYPHKALWPNGRAHWSEVARETAKHRQWAYLAAKAAGGAVMPADVIRTAIHVHPKARGPRPDATNVGHAAKAYFDGIAEAIGINDRHFAAPIVEFAMPRDGRFVIVIGILESLK